jgi:hypothetical protein
VRARRLSHATRTIQIINMAPSLSQCSQCTDTVYPIDVLPQEPTTTSSNPFVNHNLRPSSSFCQTFQDTVNVMRCGLRPPTDSVIGDPSIQTIKAESPNFAWNGSHFPSPASQTDGSSYDSEHAVWASPFQSSPRMPLPIPKRSATFPGMKHVKHPVEDALGWNAGSTPDLSYLAADTALQFSQAACSPGSATAAQICASPGILPDESSFCSQSDAATQLYSDEYPHSTVTSFLLPPRSSISRRLSDSHQIQKQSSKPRYKNPFYAVKQEMLLSQTRQQKTKIKHERLESAYFLIKAAEDSGMSNSPDSKVTQTLTQLSPVLSHTEFYILGRFAEWYRGTFGQKWSVGQHIYTLALTGGGNDFFEHYDEKVLQEFVNFQVKANRAWCNDPRADPGTLCWKCVKYFGRFRKSPCDNEWHGS